MNEERKMRYVRETVGRIEVYTDKAGRICISCMPIEAPKRSVAEQIVEYMSSIISAGSCVAMLYIIAKVAGLI